MYEFGDFDIIQVGNIQNTLLCTHIKESRIHYLESCHIYKQKTRITRGTKNHTTTI